MRRAALLLVALVLGATVPVARAGERVDVTAMDGVQLIAELDGATGPGVVVAHGAGEDGRVWRSASEALVAGGFRVLRLDLRGHGASGGASDLAAADRDVEGAYRYLLGRKIRPVFLMGKGKGAAAVAAVAGRVATAGVVLVGAADADAAKLATPVLRLETVSEPEALARLTRWLASPH
ncbi:MAG: alpha/beta fold hydrolase [Deltaproteobacteria bacterium]|nr:alpha/beta fold hydrolase [Deltaproteobacteria bacterium]